MICLSYRGTLELVDKLAEGWDQDVLLWSNEWKTLPMVSYILQWYVTVN